MKSKVLKNCAKSMYLAGASVPEISARVGVGRKTIEAWIFKENWRAERHDVLKKIEDSRTLKIFDTSTTIGDMCVAGASLRAKYAYDRLQKAVASNDDVAVEKYSEMLAAAQKMNVLGNGKFAEDQAKKFCNDMAEIRRLKVDIEIATAESSEEKTAKTTEDIKAGENNEDKENSGG